MVTRTIPNTISWGNHTFQGPIDYVFSTTDDYKTSESDEYNVHADADYDSRCRLNIEKVVLMTITAVMTMNDIIGKL